MLAIPNGPFPILEPQDQKVKEIYVHHGRHVTKFQASKLRKGRSELECCPEVIGASIYQPEFSRAIFFYRELLRQALWSISIKTVLKIDFIDKIFSYLFTNIWKRLTNVKLEADEKLPWLRYL